MNDKQLDKFIIGCMMFTSMILIWSLNIQFSNNRFALIDSIQMALIIFFMWCVIKINNKYSVKSTVK